MRPDRIVVGAEEEAATGSRLLRGLRGARRAHDVASAEMIKLAANAFLATKISFINEIANVCEAVGADVASCRTEWSWTRDRTALPETRGWAMGGRASRRTVLR